MDDVREVERWTDDVSDFLLAHAGQEAARTFMTTCKQPGNPDDKARARAESLEAIAEGLR
jgi:hypothetical protein